MGKGGGGRRSRRNVDAEGAGAGGGGGTEQMRQRTEEDEEFRDRNMQEDEEELRPSVIICPRNVLSADRFFEDGLFSVVAFLRAFEPRERERLFSPV